MELLLIPHLPAPSFTASPPSSPSHFTSPLWKQLIPGLGRKEKSRGTISIDHDSPGNSLRVLPASKLVAAKQCQWHCQSLCAAVTHHPWGCCSTAAPNLILCWQASLVCRILPLIQLKPDHLVTGEPGVTLTPKRTSREKEIERREFNAETLISPSDLQVPGWKQQQWPRAPCFAMPSACAGRDLEWLQEDAGGIRFKGCC